MRKWLYEGRTLIKRYNVLVFPGGTEIGLEIQRALCQCKNINLYSAGQDCSNHAPYVFNSYITVPSIFEEGWIESLNDVIDRFHIDYIYPAYDDIIVALARNAERIKAKVVSSPLETCVITRSKSKTYALLKDVVPVPRVYDDVEEVAGYPVFIKPDRGQGSQGAQKIDSKEELIVARERGDDIIIMEYLPGEEYTIDCFSDRDAGLMFCRGRQRARVKNGISMDSYPVDNEMFVACARAITEKLKLYGAWFFQLKGDGAGTLKLLEIAPRIAGTMAMHRVLGINFPLLSIYEQERIPVDIMLNDVHVQIDRALENRYKHDISYDTVYIDLDDTIILDGKVNLMAVQFLFKCVNEGVKIILLTRHIADVGATLKKYRLGGIFDDVIQIGKADDKSDYIVEKNAIFIDDSFSELKKVRERRGILTFDCSMLEVLVKGSRFSRPSP